MHPDLAREIAEAIVRDQLLLNWRFYALVCALTLIASAAGNWLGSYIKKRGETFATKADMQEILKQLHDTTRVTEEVRSAVSHADWVAREWRTTRRLKLEELLSTAYSIDRWLDSQKSKWVVHDMAVESDSAPMDRLKIIAALYFPELQAETTDVWFAHQTVNMLILEFAGPLNAAIEAKDGNAYHVAFNEFLARHNPLYENTRAAISALESKASKLMIEIGTK